MSRDSRRKKRKTQDDRDRRASGGWRCESCGGYLDRETDRTVRELRRRMFGQSDYLSISQVCKACNTVHISDDGVTTRRLTAADRFRIGVEAPQVMADIEQTERGEAGPDSPVITAQVFDPDEMRTYQPGRAYEAGR